MVFIRRNFAWFVLASIIFAHSKCGFAQQPSAGGSPPVDSTCFEPVQTGVYRVTCLTPGSDQIWLMPGNSHVLILLSGHVDTSTAWLEAISRQWPTMQIQILNMQVNCEQLHANQRLASWFSLPLKQTESGQTYSMAILTTRPQFSQFNRQCKAFSGLVYPGGGLRLRKNSLTGNLDIQNGWTLLLEPDSKGGQQIALLNAAGKLIVIPDFLEMAAASELNGVWPFNRFAYWVRKQNQEGYKVLSRTGEVSLESSSAALERSIEQQIETNSTTGL